MTMTDPIADMLTRIRNGQMARKTNVAIPFSKFKQQIAELLEKEGYIAGFKKSDENARVLNVTLKYHENGQPVITNITRESKPGHRKYRKSDEMPYILNGYGIAIISTSRGIMTNKDARKEGIGGEIICSVY